MFRVTKHMNKMVKMLITVLQTPCMTCSHLLDQRGMMCRLRNWLELGESLLSTALWCATNLDPRFPSVCPYLSLSETLHKPFTSLALSWIYSKNETKV